MTEPREQELATAAPWRRLDPRMLVLNLSVLATPLAGFAATAVVTSGRIPDSAYATLFPLLGIVVLMVAAGLLRYATTRYRITDERIELRTGLAFRRHLSIPRDRIRSVDLTANPLHRIFGLAVVKVGTGQTGATTDTNQLSLDAVTRTGADELRRQLLTRQPLTASGTDAAAADVASTAEGTPAGAPATAADQPIATLDWSWARYAPLTGWTLFIALILVGGAQRVLDAIGLNPFKTGLVVDVVRWLGQFSVGLVATVTAVVVLAVGVLGAIIIFVEAWWGFRLVREAAGVFSVRRGLLTTRSVSLEERRLRGVEVIEPIAMRWAGGASTKAVAAGLATSQQDQQKQKDALLPPAPLSVAHRVTAEVLAERETPVAVTDFVRHPRAALRRRLVRAVLPPLVLAAVLAAGSTSFDWLPGWPALVALALLGVTVPLAFDAYRSLGHHLTARYLVTRYGTLFRRTVALRRDGVIGWTISRSYFQRRSGLATIAATTGAGGGAYRVRDVGESEGLAFAEETVPDLLTPFLERG